MLIVNHRARIPLPGGIVFCSTNRCYVDEPSLGLRAKWLKDQIIRMPTMITSANTMVECTGSLLIKAQRTKLPRTGIATDSI